MKNSVCSEHESPDETIMTTNIKGSPYSFSNLQPCDKEKTPRNITRTRRRKLNSEKGNRVCVVCGEKASGFNFDRLTCESCKAFFRRNAMKSKEKMKPCPHGGGCNISGSQRKHCPYCRLEKCFLEGMKRELILPPEKLEQRAKPKRRKTLTIEGINEYRPSAYPVSNKSHGSTESQEILQKSYITNSPVASESAEIGYINNDKILKIENNTPPSHLNIETIPFLNGLEISLSLDDQSLLRSLSDCIAKLKEPFTPQDYPDTETAQTLEEAYNRMDTCIRRIIRLVKLLPCFSEMDKQMQLMLLRTNIYGLIIIYSSFFFEKDIRKLCYPVVNEDGNVHLITVSVSPNDLGLSDCQSNGGEGGDKDTTIINGSLKQAVQEDFELYKENTIAAFTELQELTLDDNVLKVLILAIKLFDHESIPHNMRHSVKRTRNKFSSFLMRYLRVKHKSPSVGILHFSRTLMSFIDICTLEIRMNEFAKLLSLDGLSPLMREVCSQRPPLACS